MNKNEVGRAGENLAAEYLAAQGYTILDKNWRGATGAMLRASGERRNRGELDIVAVTGTALVGVEVKTRTTERFGHPAEALTPDKVARLRRLMGQWIAEHRGQATGITEIRLDAIAIVLSPTPQITHYRGIS